MHVVETTAPKVHFLWRGGTWVLKGLSYGLGTVFAISGVVSDHLNCEQEACSLILSAFNQAIAALGSRSNRRLWRLINEQRRFLASEAAAWTGGDLTSDQLQQLADMNEALQDRNSVNQDYTRALIAMFITGAAMVAIVDFGAVALTLRIRSQIKDSARELAPQRASVMTQLASNRAAPPPNASLQPPGGATMAASTQNRQTASDHRQNRLRELQRIEKMQMIVSA